MALFLYPISTISNTRMNFINVAGDTEAWQAIDDQWPTINNTDRIYSTVGATSELEVLMSSPSETPPSSGRGSVYYEQRRTDATGADSTDGNNAFMTVTLLQGATVIAAGESASTLGSGDRSFPFDLSLITDWTNLRIRYNVTSSGGSPASRRGQGSTFVRLKIRTTKSVIFG